MKKIIPVLLFLLSGSLAVVCQLTSNKSAIANLQSEIITGAERMPIYLPMLKGKSVAVFANQTSMVKNTHLVE